MPPSKALDGGIFSHWPAPSQQWVWSTRVFNTDGFCFISRRVLPRLREMGVSEEAIRAMTVDAPRRVGVGGVR